VEAREPDVEAAVENAASAAVNMIETPYDTRRPGRYARGLFSAILLGATLPSTLASMQIGRHCSTVNDAAHD
jgi:hypothetical protein